MGPYALLIEVCLSDKVRQSIGQLDMQNNIKFVKHLRKQSANSPRHAIEANL
jgi:hypothetical protein